MTKNDLEARLRLIDLELAARTREQQAARHGAQALQEALQRLLLLSDDSAGACVATFTITVRDTCTNAVVVGAAVVASMAGQANVTGTTGVGGLLTLVVPAAGTWTITSTVSGRSKATTAVAVCGSTVTVAATTLATPALITVHLNGCFNVAIAGVAVTAAQAGVADQVQVTDASGNTTFALEKAVSTTFTLTAPRCAPFTNTTTLSCGSNGTLTFRPTNTPATGYHCAGGTTCNAPIPDTLTLNDGLGNTVALSWSAVNVWTGSHAYPANANIWSSCAGSTGGGSLTIYYTWTTGLLTMKKSGCNATHIDAGCTAGAQSHVTNLTPNAAVDWTNGAVTCSPLSQSTTVHWTPASGHQDADVANYFTDGTVLTVTE